MKKSSGEMFGTLIKAIGEVKKKENQNMIGRKEKCRHYKIRCRMVV